MRIHFLASPNTIASPGYVACAFTSHNLLLIRMLRNEGHTVIHYGHENSRTAANEHVTVTTMADLEHSYPGRDHWNAGQPAFDDSLSIFSEFSANAIREVERRKLPGDFLFCTLGPWHYNVAVAHQDLRVVEPSVGYPTGAFAQFRVYPSRAMMHAYQGTEFAATPSNDHWYESVIPLAFNPAAYTLTSDKEDYLLFVGRVNEGKGIKLARQLAEDTKTRLIVAGDGPAVDQDTEYVSHVGVLPAHKRNRLMAKARALLAPSHYMEPFGAVQIEAMLCGTPVISSDFGAFAEYNVHDQTGYRCKTYEQFKWAVVNVNRNYFDPNVLREWGEQFSITRIAPLYTEYLKSIEALDNEEGKGWFEPNPGRRDLSNTVFEPSRPSHPTQCA